MVEVGIADLLRQQSALTAIIGTSTPDIAPIPAPEDLTSYPCITFQTVSYTGEYSADGTASVGTKRIVFNCWGTTWLQAHTIADLVLSTLAGYAGTLPDGTQVFEIEIDGQEDFFESDSRLYRATIHALLNYSE